MDLKKAIGLNVPVTPELENKRIEYINLKLSTLGCPTVEIDDVHGFNEMTSSFLSHHQESARLLADYLCPPDQRIQDFLNNYLSDTGVTIKLPGNTFALDRHGLARTLSIPAHTDHFQSSIIDSYRVKQGVLHNPKSDRRTTKGSFHITEGGIPIPDDKLEVPKVTFARMLEKALQPPDDLLELPITAGQKDVARSMVSLMLRPIVCPKVENYIEEKRMEVRFFAPGNLVSNLDFVETIFGNAGNPYLPENDSGLDVDHWTGHTGCVILAPHVLKLTKKELGLPNIDDATDRQKRDSMCWEKEDDLYNGGTAFKLTCRNEEGVIITIIADNYFGYCKKEVKTQISYSANLYGLSEEEHAGGAMVFPSYDLGEEFSGHLHVQRRGHNFEGATKLLGKQIIVQPEGYGIDKDYSNIIYVSEAVDFDLQAQKVSWPHEGNTQSIKLLPGKVYVRPSGYKTTMVKPPGGRAWRLVGTTAEGTLCHKPCTVSGGGKSEISKPITDAIIQGPVFVSDFQNDFDQVEKLLKRDFTTRFRNSERIDTRPILSAERSLGSVIKLLSCAEKDYTDEYNGWIKGVPQFIKELVYVLKRFYKASWGDNWREHFSVDIIDGKPGNELKMDSRKLVSSFLRVGFSEDGSWRVFGLRKDFFPASKISREDDITASVVIPTNALQGLNPDYHNPSVKFVQNCEYRLFQRPDDAVIRGYDKATESDFASPGNFLSNYEPLPKTQARELIEDTIGFQSFTQPMQDFITGAETDETTNYFVSSAHPRIVNGEPSKNPRYLQTRPDILAPEETHLAKVALRLHRSIQSDKPVYSPVNAVLPGRRNNPPDEGVRPLAVYNPIHFMELPELFMEFICSMTGKSPSTTGAGSEGALTKGPFNALPPIIDLNATLVSYLLTEDDAFVTAAGYVGPNKRVDHDVSMLIPELWCRMAPAERKATFLIENGFLEKLEDLQHDGKPVLSSRLGYRITHKFVREFFGRIFHHPHQVFTDDYLQPELQDMAIFADGMDNIIETQNRVAQHYFNDESIEMACPPLKALLTIMLKGDFEGKDLTTPDIRSLFTKENMLKSEWYQERLKAKQALDIKLWERNVKYLEAFLERPTHARESTRLGLADKLTRAIATLAETGTTGYLEKLKGTLGVQPEI
ncbi:hypothetical protein N9B94_01565 [Verrucomicrobia bacterium]|nr:hypothetical protein [Verrucomicrobiota bacterium]